MSISQDIKTWYGEPTNVALNIEAESESINWSARKRIYLEGQSDYDIIAIRWIQNDAQIEFKPGDVANGSGCSWVLKQVSEQPGTYGIVDRDCLLNSDYIDIFFEPNIREFQRNNPFRPNVLILSCHELENFLFNIDTIFKLLINRRKMPDGKDIDWLCNKLLNIASITKSIDALFNVFRLLDLSLPRSASPSFCCGKSNIDHIYRLALDLFKKEAEDIAQSIKHNNIYDLGADVQPDNILACLNNSYAELIHRYNNFDTGDNESLRLTTILQIIDGKRFICHLRNHFRLSDPIEYDLADWIAINGHIPNEIIEFVQYIRSN